MQFGRHQFGHFASAGKGCAAIDDARTCAARQYVVECESHFIAACKDSLSAQVGKPNDQWFAK